MERSQVSWVRCVDAAYPERLALGPTSSIRVYRRLAAEAPQVTALPALSVKS